MLTKRFKASAPQRLNQAARANLREPAQSSRRERDRDRFNPRGRRIARRNLFTLVFTDRKREFDGFPGHRQRFLDRGPERRDLGKSRHDDLKGILVRLQYHGVLQFGHAMGFAERARMPLGEGARTPATTYAVNHLTGVGTPIDPIGPSILANQGLMLSLGFAEGYYTERSKRPVGPGGW